MSQALLMTPKGIKIKDVGAVRAYLSSVFGRAKEWTAHYDWVESAAKIAERKLAAYPIGKVDFVGATAFYRTAGPSAKAYRFPVKGSVVALRRHRDGWRVIAAEFCQRWPRDPAEVNLTLTDEQKSKIAAAYAARSGERDYED